MTFNASTATETV